jgi:hypothetical protein
MKRYALLAGAAILAAACGSDNPAGPSAPPNTINFTAALSAANENPPITNADTNARGTARITMNLTRDSAGAITDATANFSFDLSGFPGGTSIILSHIHEGAPSVNGGVKVDSGLRPASPVVLANGTVTNQTFTNLPVGASLGQQIIDNPNGYYFNVHSQLNPTGAVRGQLVKQ